MRPVSLFREKIKKSWSGAIFWDCPLQEYTTLKVGGPADALVKAGSAQQLQDLVQSLHNNSVPWMVIGRGSNLLVSDNGVEGVVIVLGEDFSAITRIDDGNKKDGQSAVRKVCVEAGCSLAKLGKWCKEHSVGGLEFAVGIPGSLGGAIMMNAGAWGCEIKDVLGAVDVMTNSGRIARECPEKSDFVYRKWQKGEGKIVVAATLNLVHSDPLEIGKKCHEYLSKRHEKQPKGVASAGSFFKNHPNAPAGMLIEKAGLKGVSVGGAQVSQKHANFLVNTGMATAQDFFELMKIVQRAVFEKFKVELETEVKLIGRWQSMSGGML
jgi:UDP-N-acetylmuramate dehydrogenase